MACPTLWADAWDLSVGDNVRGVATAHDGEWVIALNANFVDSGTFYVYDRETKAELFTKDIELGTGVHRSNFTADNDGNVYYWEQTATVYRLWQIDLNDLSSGFEVTDISTSAVMDGPSWNPNDGLIYDLSRTPTTTLKLLRFNIADITNELAIWTGTGATTWIFTDGVVFDNEGGIWWGAENDVGEGVKAWRALETSPGSYLVSKYDSAEMSATSDSHGIPTTDLTLMYRRTSAEITKEVQVGGSIIDSACILPSAAGVGTGRVNCGVNNLVSFLYPTSSGSGRYIYLPGEPTSELTGTAWAVGWT